jgi:hypothetical protein
MSEPRFDEQMMASGRQSVSRHQVNEVLKNLNIREGLFSEDDFKQLEHGYSVSESEDDDDYSVKSGAISMENQSPNYHGHDRMASGIDRHERLMKAE